MVNEKNNSSELVKQEETKSNSVGFLKSIESFEDLEKISKYIANSPIYNGPFKEDVETEDGKSTKVVNENAIITCLMLGHEIGLSPMKAITFGRLLDRRAVLKCEKGSRLGLDPISSLQNIYVFETKSAELIYTGIHVVNKVLTDCGVKREIIDDGTKPYKTYTAQYKEQKGELVEFDSSKHFIINGLAPQQLKDALEKGLKPVQENITRRGLVKLTRHHKSYKEVIEIPYTLQQAIEADLYKGTKSDGSISKGKDNWNNHPETHLLKMSIMLGGRIIASDKLNGIYIPEELGSVRVSEIIDKSIIEDAEFEDVIEEVTQQS